VIQREVYCSGWRILVIEAKRKKMSIAYRLVHDSVGGLVFTRDDGETVETLHMWDDGEAEVIVMRDGKAVERIPLDPAGEVDL